MARFNYKSAALALEEKTLSGEIRILPHEEPIVIHEPIIDGNAISAAYRIADKIQSEAHHWIFGRKHVIRNGLKNLNTKNAYNFIGYMITTSHSQSVLGDYKSAVNYDCLKHLVFCFMIQAKEFGYEETFQYRKLKKEYNIILKASNKSLFGNVSRKIMNETAMFIENLYFEMNKSLR